eukprot:TRINITY_DN13441_c1_g1_i30.p1 TRINITY_DN13441_c1_g1~~TRINITY_DN13441_c1_g1_i30.p1  ORF type:complete len:621 (-),score=157.89 TRINITY_DN13441_c1_g1_i30:272-2134(-)
MKLTAMPVLHHMLKPIIAEICKGKRSCELDPRRIEDAKDAKKNLEKNRQNLANYCAEILASTLNIPKMLPLTLRNIFCEMRQHILQRWPDHPTVRYSGPSGFIFLRFICPAILGPALYFLCSDHPSANVARDLTLIAKCIQNLANLRLFGSKEPFMTPMNEFLEKNLEAMRCLLDEVSTPPTSPIDEIPRTHLNINFGKEMALISNFFSVQYPNFVKVYGADHPKFLQLKAVLNGIDEDKKLVECMPTNSRKSTYIPLMNPNTVSVTTTTSTSTLSVTTPTPPPSPTKAPSPPFSGSVKMTKPQSQIIPSTSINGKTTNRQKTSPEDGSDRSGENSNEEDQDQDPDPDPHLDPDLDLNLDPILDPNLIPTPYLDQQYPNDGIHDETSDEHSHESECSDISNKPRPEMQNTLSTGQFFTPVTTTTTTTTTTLPTPPLNITTVTNATTIAQHTMESKQNSRRNILEAVKDLVTINTTHSSTHLSSRESLKNINKRKGDNLQDNPQDNPNHISSPLAIETDGNESVENDSHSDDTGKKPTRGTTHRGNKANNPSSSSSVNPSNIITPRNSTPRTSTSTSASSTYNLQQLESLVSMLFHRVELLEKGELEMKERLTRLESKVLS